MPGRTIPRTRKGTAARCTRRACDTLLDQVIGLNGAVSHVCKPCERNKQGLCRDCPALLPEDTHPNKRAPQRMRCDPCTLKHNTKRRKALYHVDPERHRAIKRKSSRKPHVRKRQQRNARAWRERNPYTPDAATRAYARQYMRDYLEDPVVRERVNARRRELAAEKRAAVVARGEHKRLYPKPFGPRQKSAPAQRERRAA